MARALHTGEIDGEPARIQTIAQEYPAGIDDVWDATTSPERIARWFLPVSGDLRIGGRYRLTGNASGEILSCTPPSDGTAGYRVTWEFAGGVSWVRVRLTSLGPERTRFELEHTSRVADMPAEMWDTFGPGATGVGWDQGLLGLALHLGVQDGRIAPEEAEEWALSDEGKAFARAAADRWADAYIAAGADREVAARTAEATFGFYTGRPPGA
ncbi:SRPBCC domain-containing protein [Embleya sp. NPDC008237]|uniref:SRPBCC domain-containing protein n=1 Tax=Embleya sp. NPDC008237 TaxID=3363978 RepID=UPI0036E2D0EA